MIQKLLIYDKGIGHIGKSRSVKAVFHRLMAEHRGDITEIYVRHGSIRFEDRRDLCVLFKYRGIQVGLESQGDPDCRLVDSLKEFSKRDCDIIICACRTKGDDYDFMQSMMIAKGGKYFPASCPHFVIGEIKEGYHDVLAERYADGVIAIMDDWINL